ncbi:MAG: hemolysin III family protein [Clostridia bacterium]|nr:hemolysin III family protein [Clostridia bacterium]
MTRTKLANRPLPDYTRGEELFNMISHIVGGALGIAVLVSSVALSALRSDVWAIVGCSIYGVSMVALYTMSSVYHGLRDGMAKRVLQVIDHCTIYFLIAGTYTPILLCAMRRQSPAVAWVVFGIEWGLTALAVTLTAIDLKKYQTFSMICYIGMGWCIIMAIKPTIAALTMDGFLWILAGGIAYTVGSVLYGVGKKVRYMHSVFHLFVIAGSFLQFIGIIFYAL